MAVILDGYNVLFAIARYGGRPVADAIEEARTRLLRHLVGYTQATGQGVTVVFDSRRGSGGARRDEMVEGIRIVHAHPPRTADDEILRLVGASTAPQHLLVVTSDRELASACARSGADVVGAKTFFREVTAHARDARDDEQEQRLKQQAPSDDEVREWLNAFSENDVPQQDHGSDWDDWLA